LLKAVSFSRGKTMKLSLPGANRSKADHEAVEYALASARDYETYAAEADRDGEPDLAQFFRMLADSFYTRAAKIQGGNNAEPTAPTFKERIEVFKDLSDI
jgi:hypothetical protein